MHRILLLGATAGLVVMACTSPDPSAPTLLSKAHQREQAKVMGWKKMPFIDARESHTMVAYGSKVLLFGGHTGAGPSNETWEWDGTEWTQRFPRHRPPARELAAMGVVAGRVVLYGGINSSFNKLPEDLIRFSDTWEWDGGDWTERTPPVSPPSLWGMVHAVFNGRLVIFGGSATAGSDGETWEWDGASWTRKQVSASPPVRSGAVMAALSNRAVLLGNDHGAPLDLWEWDGARWTASAIPSPPLKPDAYSYLLAAWQGKLTALGTSLADRARMETWAWDGSAWSELKSLTVPPSRICARLAVMQDRLVLFGGDGPRNDTWELGGAGWTERAQMPAPRSDHWIVQAGPTVLLGGGRASTLLYGQSPRYLSDVWEWSGQGWTKLSAEDPCVLGRGATVAGTPILHCGRTWEWNGQTWIERASAVNAPYLSGMASFGTKLVGLAAGYPLPEMWEWEGGAWSKRSPATIPALVDSISMAQVGTKVLAVGNPERSNPTSGPPQTWEWDGINWQQRFPQTYPSFAIRPQIASLGEGALLVGPGSWLWDGQDWGQEDSVTQPPRRADHALAQHAGGVLLFGGAGSSVWSMGLSDTWHYGSYVTAGGVCASTTECLSGFCVDGVCCDLPCDGQCESCALPGHEGTCLPVSGVPRGDRTACAGAGTLCAGTCNGVHPASCVYPGDETECRAAGCALGVASASASCDGAGACSAPVEQPCMPYGCADSACAASCLLDADCAAGHLCRDAVCLAKAANGATCTEARECASGQCIDGFCCDGACGGQCESCAVPGQEGICSPVVGAPIASRARCSGTGSVCGGLCNGVERAACVYPGPETSCRGASCSQGIATSAATCDGAGSCAVLVSHPCSPFGCQGTVCAKTCQGDADCAGGTVCKAGNCAPPPQEEGGGTGCGCSNAAGPSLPVIAAALLLSLRRRRRE